MQEWMKDLAPCRSCGRVIDNDARFCPNCGNGASADPRLLAHEDRQAAKIAYAIDQAVQMRAYEAEMMRRRRQQARRDAPMHPALKIALCLVVVFLVGLAVFIHYLATAPYHGAYQI